MTNPNPVIPSPQTAELERPPAVLQSSPPLEEGMSEKACQDIIEQALRQMVIDEDRRNGLPNPGSPSPTLNYAIGLTRMDPLRIITRRELATALGCGIRTTRRMEERGEIPPAGRLGHRAIWQAGLTARWVAVRLAHKVYADWAARQKLESGEFSSLKSLKFCNLN